MGSLDSSNGFGRFPAIAVTRSLCKPTLEGDARHSIQGGGLYLNNERITDAGQTVTFNQSINGQCVIVRKDRKNTI
jgi:tyrosyl-tRNA synthetase